MITAGPQRPVRSADDIRKELSALEKELRDAEHAEQLAAQAGNAKRAIALLSAMRECMRTIEDIFPGTFEGEKWAALTPQAWPRITKFKRAAELSETEVANAQVTGRKAVEGIK